MNRRTLLNLLGALVALAVLAVIALVTERDGPRHEAAFLPDLKDRLNDIRRIAVTGPGDVAIATLERGADIWTVSSRDNYPADMGRIRKNLLALAEARVVEEKTSSPEFYARLGVQDIADEAAGGVLLTLTADEELASVIVGQSQSGSPELTYARRAGEAASWLITGQFDLGKTAGEWLDHLVTDIPAERIASVSITHPGQETLRIARPAPAGEVADGPVDFEVAGVPAGRELTYPGVANSVAAALADLRLEDVARRDSLGETPGKPVVARFVTTDGLTVETSAWRHADGTRVTFLASGDGEAAVQEAEALNARLGGWVYTLPDYKTEQLTRRMQDLLAAQ